MPGLNISSDYFWKTFEDIVERFSERNRELLNERENLQSKIDDWHIQNKDFNSEEYKNFLTDIGYIHPRSPDFKIKTWNVDPEIRKIAGPQLVVPVMNARFALNATNARWGSLYDALYGTDVIPGERGGSFNKNRAIEAIAYVRKFLDDIAPIDELSWREISNIKIKNKNLIFLSDKDEKYLKNKDQFIGFNGEAENPRSILIKNNNLHIEISIDPNR